MAPAAPADAFELRLSDARYPEQLRQTPDPPPVLYGVGDPGALESGLAVVGSRKATPYGLAIARLMAGWAARQGIVVVSGGAIGCDQAAHLAALDEGGRTVAVLGCGADIDYPRGASSLLGELRGGESGCVVSEQPWNTPPLRWAFARRNRIIAGLANAVLIVEASLPSGTFSTADFALDAGRQVLVVPGSIFAPECLGSNRLIRQGATPITDVSDLAAELGTLVDSPRPIRHLPPSNDPLLRALIVNAMRPDDAARDLGLSIVEVARRIGALESEGLIARYPDGRYGPC